MKTSTKTLFLIMTLISTMLVLNTSSWISMWIGLEMNLMSFIPLISTKKDPMNSQSIMMYFLIQSLASMLFMITILIMKYMFTYNYENMTKTLIFIMMMIKMGMPPFHMWLPEMMNKISWKACLLLMTWQKIAPMYIISMVTSTNKMIITTICLASLVGAMGGLNQTSVKKILAYSSINHMSWMVACATWFKKSWMVYLATYTVMMIAITMALNQFNIIFINQMNIFMKSMASKVTMMFFMLSIGGLPPFLGFIPKWITIQYMISTKEFTMMMIMVTCALITLSYYLRLTTSMNLIMNQTQKWMQFKNLNSNMTAYLFSLNMALPMLIFMMNFY